MIVSDFDLEALAVSIKENEWVTRTLRYSTDDPMRRLWEAARRVVENVPGPEPTPTGTDAPRLLASFHVMGLPAPQGSKTVVRAGGAHRAIEGSSTAGRAKLSAWRQAIVDRAAKVAAEVGCLNEPVHVKAEFRLPMPKSRPKGAQLQGLIPCTVKPDIDKLERALLDGMVQGGLLRDDSLVWSVNKRKVEVIGWTGCTVHIMGGA